MNARGIEVALFVLAPRDSRDMRLRGAFAQDEYTVRGAPYIYLRASALRGPHASHVFNRGDCTVRNTPEAYIREGEFNDDCWSYVLENDIFIQLVKGHKYQQRSYNVAPFPETALTRRLNVRVALGPL